MRVLLPREARFHRTPDGAVWIQSSTTYQFWQRYLEVFDSVEVLARIQDVNSVPDDFNRSDGPNVQFVPLPYYLGPMDYFRQRRHFNAELSRSLSNSHAVILRSPGQVSSSSRAHLAAGRPYGIEVVGDPGDVFSRGAIKHPLRPLMRHWFVRDLKKVVGGAHSVSYVTERTLQEKYPPRPDAFTTHYSSIELNPNAFVVEPRDYSEPLKQVRGLLIGSLEQMYKGADILLEAMAQCRKRDIELSVAIVGGGRHQDDLRALSASLGIERSVDFRGQLPSGDFIRSEIDGADIFIMPSRTEGLPRAMIEAMARGLPCVGTRVGGIPELLPDEDLVPANDSLALANKIIEVVSDPARMTRMSSRNLEKAHEYRSDVLRKRRSAFYQHVQEANAFWQGSRRT